MKKLLLLTLISAYSISMYAMELTESATEWRSQARSAQSESSDKVPARKSRSATESSSESTTTLSSSSEKISNPVVKSDSNEFVDAFAAAATFANPQELRILIHAAAMVATATKEDKHPRTSALLQQEIDRLSSAIAETKAAYEENKKKGEEAIGRIKASGGSYGFMNWTPDEQIQMACEEKRKEIQQELVKLEQQVANIKYELFRNHIKHSHPTKLKMAIPNAIGCFESMVSPQFERTLYPQYCLFTQEQKMDLYAYAQTIIPKRIDAVQGARDCEDGFSQSHDPKVREKHEKACQVLLLMKEFKNMSFERQQSFSNWLTRKTA